MHVKIVLVKGQRMPDPAVTAGRNWSMTKDDGDTCEIEFTGRPAPTTLTELLNRLKENGVLD